MVKRNLDLHRFKVVLHASLYLVKVQFQSVCASRLDENMREEDGHPGTYTVTSELVTIVLRSPTTLVWEQRLNSVPLLGC